MVNGRSIEDEKKRIDSFFDVLTVEEFEDILIKAGAKPRADFDWSSCVLDSKKLEEIEKNPVLSKERIKECIQSLQSNKRDKIEKEILSWGYETIGDLSNGIPYHTITLLAKHLSKVI